MLIPKRITLAGQVITIVRDPNLYTERKILGEALYSKSQIVLDTGACPQQVIEQNFLHELVHWIYFIMNEDEHRNNEKMVDLFAHLLHQATISAEFE